MKITLLAFISFLIILLSGCSSYKAMKHFNQDDLLTKAVQNSKKINLIHNNEVNAIINLTYLNAVDKEFDTNTQNFMIGLYIIDVKYKNEFKKPYLITMNNNKALDIKKIEKNHKMYTNIPIKNKWAKYYIVSFKKEKKDINLEIDITYENSNKSSLSFIAN